MLVCLDSRFLMSKITQPRLRKIECKGRKSSKDRPWQQCGDVGKYYSINVTSTICIALNLEYREMLAIASKTTNVERKNTMANLNVFL